MDASFLVLAQIANQMFFGASCFPLLDVFLFVRVFIHNDTLVIFDSKKLIRVLDLVNAYYYCFFFPNNSLKASKSLLYCVVVQFVAS